MVVNVSKNHLNGALKIPKREEFVLWYNKWLTGFRGNFCLYLSSISVAS